MIGLDTNVVVRMLIDDDVKQGQVVAGLLKKHDEFYINLVVLVEVCWVLDSGYDVPKEELIKLIESLLSIQQLQVEKSNLVWLALEEFKTSKADFADCLIGVLNHESGCSVSVTFDKDLKKNHHFSILS